MKILYALQGTGNGHISRAREIVPHLRKYGEVDLLISGGTTELSLDMSFRHRLRGLTFYLNGKGNIRYFYSLRKNGLRQFYRDVKSFPIKQYDLILNDFEPITAWACRLKAKPGISMSHQAALLSPKTPRPAKRDWIGEWVLKNFAPLPHRIGFHFDTYDQFIYPPIIRRDIRELAISDGGYYTVYLPGYYVEELLKHLVQLPKIRWQVFSSFTKRSYQTCNVSVFPIDNNAFLESFAHCRGLLTGAGFEAPAEAIFHGKKLMVVPIRNHYEQACNAVALEQLGVKVVQKMDADFSKHLQDWIDRGKQLHNPFPDYTAAIVERIVSQHTSFSCPHEGPPGPARLRRGNQRQAFSERLPQQ
ncbi:MAG: glycosyltransferase family protein [Bacteroidota bacterium]